MRPKSDLELLRQAQYMERIQMFVIHASLYPGSERSSQKGCKENRVNPIRPRVTDLPLHMDSFWVIWVLPVPGPGPS